MVIMLSSAVLKSYDVTEFAISLSTWNFIPAKAIALTAIGIPAIEMALALSWIVGIARRACVFGIALLLIAYSIGYVGSVASGGKPSCACFGAQAAFLDTPILVIARNCTLLLMLVAGTVPIRFNARGVLP